MKDDDIAHALHIGRATVERVRRVEVTERRTRVDWARVVKQLVDVDYLDY